MYFFKKASVKAVEKALAAAGLAKSAVKVGLISRRGVEAVARFFKTDPGAIVQVSCYLIGEQPVLALHGGSVACSPDNLPRIFNLSGTVRTCDAAETMAATGFEPGGVPPLPAALALPLPMTLDAGLKRFPIVYVPAGHPHWRVAMTVDELKRLSGALVSYNVTATPDRQGHIDRAGWRALQT